ncbi:ribbon-helix-helix domain-containing protein [Kiloniella sp.]|uniref:ribbon-helix-helix domain-containing protein n=1 Tax=Kiloniella sp. TaxID=1938587 RepID=UPI003B018C8A
MRKTITIPNAMDGWVKSQIESGRYGNDSEYFRDLIRRDQDKNIAELQLVSLNKRPTQKYPKNKPKRVL